MGLREKSRDGLRLQRVRAAPGRGAAVAPVAQVAPVAPVAGQVAGQVAGMPRLALPEQPARGGLPTRRENLIFGIWSLLSVIRRALKMKREV